MKVKDLDRVVLLVKDLDKTMGFFSDVLGIDLIEHTGEPSGEILGMRVAMNLDYRLELVQPLFPLPDTAPLYLKRLSKLLEDRDNVLINLGFLVEDVDETAEELKQKGIRIADRYEVEEFNSWSLRNFQEVVTDEEDTLGIPLVLAKYDRV